MTFSKTLQIHRSYTTAVSGVARLRYFEYAAFSDKHPNAYNIYGAGDGRLR